jgi:hypothetical protein
VRRGPVGRLLAAALRLRLRLRLRLHARCTHVVLATSGCVPVLRPFPRCAWARGRRQQRLPHDAEDLGIPKGARRLHRTDSACGDVAVAPRQQHRADARPALAA